jgi:hypothetical protein
LEWGNPKCRHCEPFDLAQGPEAFEGKALILGRPVPRNLSEEGGGNPNIQKNSSFWTGKDCRLDQKSTSS